MLPFAWSNGASVTNDDGTIVVQLPDFEEAMALADQGCTIDITAYLISDDATIGALVLFVLWLYYTALVFLLGGVVAETWELRRMQQRQRAILR